MKNLSFRAVAALLLGMFSSQILAYGTGLSTFPLMNEQKIISTEFTGITSRGGGLGLQARFTQKIDEFQTVDAGLGIAGGERNARLFAGYDYELFPDYEYQPKTTLKAFIENAKEFGVRKNVLGFAPTFSKGLSISDKEIFPFLSVPVGISLNNKNNTYNTSVSANLGVSTLFQTENSKALTTAVELVLGVRESYSGLFVSVGYPIE